MARPLDRTDDHDDLARLPQDLPFDVRTAEEHGVPGHRLRRLTARGALRRPFRGVYVLADVVDSLEVRAAALRLVVPGDCVVTDRTAAWLWGAPMVLAPGDQRATPALSVYAPPGRRLRGGPVDSGERRVRGADVAVVDGLRATTPLRTACDLLRLLHRDQALGAVDMLAGRTGLTAERVASELGRFRRYRGVVQARVLAPLVDGRAGSPQESVLRLRWYDAGLPRPECQVEVEAPRGTFLIDVGLPEERFGAEYFGADVHTEAHAPYDQSRLDWIREVLGWSVPVLRRDDVHGVRQRGEAILRAAWTLHRSGSRRVVA